MRLMIAVFLFVLLVLIDQFQFHGHYTTQSAYALRSALAQFGL
jgi:hypothetical protein